MRLTPVTFALRDGRAAVLRSAEPDDAPRVLECLRTVLGESDFLMRYPEECTWTEEQERGILGAILDDPVRAMLVCAIEGEIAGICGAQRFAMQKIRHRGTIDISLRKRYWGLGLGSAMFREMIRAARAMGISRLELEVIDGNARAMRLYEKMGFVPFAEHPDAIRTKDGRSMALISMAKVL